MTVKRERMLENVIGDYRVILFTKRNVFIKILEISCRNIKSLTDQFIIKPSKCLRIKGISCQNIKPLTQTEKTRFIYYIDNMLCCHFDTITYMLHKLQQIVVKRLIIRVTVN